MDRRLTAIAAVVVLGLSACPKPSLTPAIPPPPPPPPPMRIPEGCAQSQAGSYEHAQNRSFRYEATDDGGTLLLFVERPRIDGGFSSEDGGAVISLTRTPNGFTGDTSAQVFTPRGSRCRVSFPTEVTACFDGGIALRSAVSASVDDNCQVPKKTAPAPRLEHLLLRVREEREPADAGLYVLATEDAGIPLKTKRPPVSDGGVAAVMSGTMSSSDGGNPMAELPMADAGARGTGEPHSPRHFFPDGGAGPSVE